MNHDDCSKIGAPPCWCQPVRIGDGRSELANAKREQKWRAEQIALLTRIAEAGEQVRDDLYKIMTGERGLRTYD